MLMIKETSQKEKGGRDIEMREGRSFLSSFAKPYEIFTKNPETLFRSVTRPLTLTVVHASTPAEDNEAC